MFSPTHTDATAEQPSLIQSWFQSWSCCKADVQTNEVLVDPEDLPKSPKKAKKAKKAAQVGSTQTASPRAAKKDVVCKYKLDNSILKLNKTPGVAFRSSKNQADKLKTVARWGDVVEGVDEGDDWLRVGEHYLPMKHKGTQVVTLLTEEETFSPKTGVPPSPARAAANAAPQAASPKIDSVVEESVLKPEWLAIQEKKDDVDEPMVETKEQAEVSAKDAVNEEEKVVQEADAEAKDQTKTPTKEIQDAAEQTPGDASVEKPLSAVMEQEQQASGGNCFFDEDIIDMLVEGSPTKEKQDSAEQELGDATVEKPVVAVTEQEDQAATDAAIVEEPPFIVPSPKKEDKLECTERTNLEAEVCDAIESATIVKTKELPLSELSTIKSPLEKLFMEAILQQRAENTKLVAEAEA